MTILCLAPHLKCRWRSSHPPKPFACALAEPSCLYELPRPRAAQCPLRPFYWPENVSTLVSLTVSTFYSPKEEPQEGLLPELGHFSPPLLQIHPFTQRVSQRGKANKSLCFDLSPPPREVVLGAYRAILSGGPTVLETSCL